MSLVIFFTNIVVSIFEVLMMYYFYNKVLTLRELSKSFIFLYSVLIGTVIMFIGKYLLELKYVSIIFFIAFLCYTFIYKEGIAKKFLAAIIIFAILTVSELLVGTAMMALGNLKEFDLQYNEIYYFQGAILSKIVALFISRIIGVFKINNKLDISIKNVLYLCTIPVSLTICIGYLSKIITSNNSTYPPAMIFISALVAFAVIANFNIFEKQLELQKSEDLLINLENQYKLQSEYYTELKQNLILTNKNTHDIKNLLIGISAFIDSDNKEIAKEKIEEFYGKIPEINTINTGNDAVNALMRSKTRIIDELIHQKDISIILPNELKIDEIDLCVFIGNAIDNAIEACKKLEDEQKRFIEIKIFPYGNQLSMMFKNSKINETDTFFKTTKPEKYLHGFGIENMKAICSKYDGNIVFDQSDEAFIVSALFPNCPVKHS